MTLESLAAALEERLLFYADVAEHLSEAAGAEDEEKVRQYADLERETGARIAALTRCFLARKTEAADTADITDRVERAGARAASASRRARSRLHGSGRNILERLRESRKNTPRDKFAASSPAPSLVDLRA